MVVSEQYYTAKPVLVLPATCQGRLCSRPHGGADAVWQLKKKNRTEEEAELMHSSTINLIY